MDEPNGHIYLTRTYDSKDFIHLCKKTNTIIESYFLMLACESERMEWDNLMKYLSAVNNSEKCSEAQTRLFTSPTHISNFWSSSKRWMNNVHILIWPGLDSKVLIHFMQENQHISWELFFSYKPGTSAKSRV